jgi:hypothetical protein
MSNSRKWTTDFNAVTEQLSAFVKAKAGRSRIKRIEAMQRAATMPNSLPQSPRVAGQGAK